ncbi:DUF1799 domain-containing protein [Palleronia caenipelagi]|uniref:Uncharacterized protein n=1 Tax=Palleronia caenipelagi TaxID=2489174 RepID=A0A547PW54_9RHOB|nr:DUF1799 domain-containing protein [Palleronia caenipelagi]TRD18348.1 hypothetical protein FEV53_11880 [Palleronia caenipelagi]
MGEEEIAAMIAELHPDTPLELPALFRPAITLITALSGQWRMAGGGLGPLRPVALDLTALDVAARWLGIAPSPRLLSEIRILEAEALRQMRDRP